MNTVKALVEFFDNKINNLEARNLALNKAASPRASSSNEIVQRIQQILTPRDKNPLV